MRLRLVSLRLFSVFLAYPHPAVTNHNAGQTACAILAASLGQTIVQFPGSPEYIVSDSGAWNFFNTEYAPACMVFPQNATHVQTSMRAIYDAGAQYAVQAGSHSAMVGWNNVQDGVLVLFSNMANIHYDSTADTIVLQPGVHWGDVVSTLAPLGVTAVGGRQSDVGTGLLLGGGLSFLSPAHGFAADSYKALDIVLVSGQLVTATATNEYADLFRALKGGGNRFGIVTRYELYAIHTGTSLDLTWYGGTIVYANSSVEAVITATAHYVENVMDPKAVLLTSIVNVITAGVIAPTIAVNLFYNGTALPSSVFGEFLAIPSINQALGPLSYYDISTVLPPGNERGNGQHYGASALVGSETLFLDAFKHWTNFTNTYAQDFDMTVLAFTPVLQPQIDAGRARGGNAISPPDGGYAAVQIAQQFPAGVTNITPIVQKGIDFLFTQIPPSAGKPLFMNECDKKQNVFATYGEYEWLKQTYAKYDPSRFNVGHTQGPVGL